MYKPYISMNQSFEIKFGCIDDNNGLPVQYYYFPSFVRKQNPCMYESEDEEENISYDTFRVPFSEEEEEYNFEEKSEKEVFFEEEELMIKKQKFNFGDTTEFAREKKKQKKKASHRSGNIFSVGLRPRRRKHALYSSSFPPEMCKFPYKYTIRIESQYEDVNQKYRFNILEKSLKSHNSRFVISKFVSVCSRKLENSNQIFSENGESQNSQLLFEIQFKSTKNVSTGKHFILEMIDSTKKIVFKSNPFKLRSRKSKLENEFWEKNSELSKKVENSKKLNQIKIGERRKKKKIIMKIY